MQAVVTRFQQPSSNKIIFLLGCCEKPKESQVCTSWMYVKSHSSLTLDNQYKTETNETKFRAHMQAHNQKTGLVAILAASSTSYCELMRNQCVWGGRYVGTLAGRRSNHLDRLITCLRQPHISDFFHSIFIWFIACYQNAKRISIKKK